jgi:hypothetical protein
LACGLGGAVEGGRPALRNPDPEAGLLFVFCS